MVTMPGFLLAPFNIFLTVVGGIPALRANALMAKCLSWQSSMIRFATHSRVVMMIDHLIPYDGAIVSKYAQRAELYIDFLVYI